LVVFAAERDYLKLRIEAAQAGDAIALQSAAVDEMRRLKIAGGRVDDELGVGTLDRRHASVTDDGAAVLLKELGIFLGHDLVIDDAGRRAPEPRDRSDMRFVVLDLLAR